MPAQPSSTRGTTQAMHYPGETIILEQPASKALRFRYECEGRSAGSIPGVHSTPENKTYPTIQVRGYQGRAVVVVSCVTKDAPYRPHPHNLVGKEGCKRGVCTLEINNKDMTVSFSNLGIQCVKKRDIEDALKQREEIRVDPFRTGFGHKTQPSTVDLNVVRLCFQVFLEGEKGKFTRPLAPVVSEPIYDKKAMSDLVICKLSDCTSSVLGNRDIILLCEKVAKEDIAVRFFEEQNGQTVWEANGEFQHSAVHKQVAIAFKTPPYKTTQITDNVKVFIQLVRPSDGVYSDPLPFEYTPIDTDHNMSDTLRRKVRKVAQNRDMFAKVFEQIPPDERNVFRNISPAGPSTVKTEPRDQTPSPYGHQQTTPIQMFAGGQMFEYRNNLVAGSPSPQPLTTTQQPGSLPYNVSPQPQFTLPPATSQYGTSPAFLPSQSTFVPPSDPAMFPESHLAPLTTHFISPVPMEMQSTQQIPPPASMHLHMLSTNTQNPQDSIGGIDPIEDFQINSSEIRSLLNEGDFSSLNSGQQRMPPMEDRDNDQCLSDSLDKQCRF
ncbi:embryonic polarity protein dorsal-like isoform X2 [Culicoides brevitarsis]